jgi:hypothetical protein
VVVSFVDIGSIVDHHCLEVVVCFVDIGVIVEIKYFLNLNEYDFPICILSIHFRQISFF